MSHPRQAQIDAFWSCFRAHADELKSLTSAEVPAYDALMAELRKVGEGLWIEIGGSDFILTAEGRKDLFELVEHVIAAAPATPDWTFIALKPKLGFPKKTSWESFELELAGVSFHPLENRKTGGLGLRLYVPGLREEEATDAHNALLRAIDHGLGERAFAEDVEMTDVAPLPEGKRPEDFILLADLEEYIAWRKKKRPT